MKTNRNPCLCCAFDPGTCTLYTRSMSLGLCARLCLSRANFVFANRTTCSWHPDHRSYSLVRPCLQPLPSLFKNILTFFAFAQSAAPSYATGAREVRARTASPVTWIKLLSLLLPSITFIKLHTSTDNILSKVRMRSSLVLRYVSVLIL